MSNHKNQLTTIQVRKYVVQQVRPKQERWGLSLNLLTERLFNLWLSGSIDTMLLPEQEHDGGLIK